LHHHSPAAIFAELENVAEHWEIPGT